MKLSKAVIWLSLLVAALVLAAAATGVFSQTSGAHINFVTARGATSANGLSLSCRVRPTFAPSQRNSLEVSCPV